MITLLAPGEECHLDLSPKSCAYPTSVKIIPILLHKYNNCPMLFCTFTIDNSSFHTTVKKKMFYVSLFSVTKFLIYKFKLLSLLKRLCSMSSTKNIHDPLPVTPWHRPDLLKACNIKALNYKIMLLYEYLTKLISPYLIYLMHFIVKNDFIRVKHWQFLLKQIIK